jgi:nitric-oxide synthase, bacterial
MHTDSYVRSNRAPTARISADDAPQCPSQQQRTTGSPTDLIPAAIEFLGMLAEERRPSGLDLRARIDEVIAEIELTGTYRHTTLELRYGAELAWRQSVRCVGRARWRNLRVRDRRDIGSANGIATELVEHITAATNGGVLRNTITIFAPDHPVAGPHARIWNDQLIRYAGHTLPDGRIVGDPAQAEFTRLVLGLGWPQPGDPGRFDILPWVVETWYEQPRVYLVPPLIVLEVDLTHPQYPWFAELGLRWHALPVISNMRLHIGGVDYSCAPFSGFYLGDEIATRNLGGEDRYDQLPVVAARLGLDPTDQASMWREHAALVLNQAVLHSFREAGVSITDGYTESKKFVQFAAREEAAARAVHADWTWVNGHFGHSLGPAFHRYYDESEPPTNFWTDRHRLAGPSLADRHAALAAQIGVGAR